LLRLIGTEAQASSTLIVSPQFAADIKAGCTGIEPIIILVSAMFAFRASWKAKCYGAILGILILQGPPLQFGDSFCADSFFPQSRLEEKSLGPRGGDDPSLFDPGFYGPRPG